MVKITTPMKGYTGVVAGVTFADGVGETDDPAALLYFTSAGYGVDSDEQPSEVAQEAPAASRRGKTGK